MITRIIDGLISDSADCDGETSRERISADLQGTMESINHNQRVKCVRARMQPKMDTVITRRLTGHSFVVDVKIAVLYRKEI